VNQTQPHQISATCQCGKVKFEAVGPPILTGACYCTSCQQAGHQFGQLPNAPPLLDPDSGTSMVLCRKGSGAMRDGTAISQRASAQTRISDPTGRCRLLQFGDVPRFHQRALAIDVPQPLCGRRAPLEMRIMTAERRAGVELADDVPNYPRHSGKFMLKLIAAWIAMGFRRPEISWGKPVRAD
jgi:hypothetical protein